MAEIIYTATDDNLLYTTTTTHGILPDKQHYITKTITSLVHTDVSSIRQSILSNLPGLIDQSNPMSNTASADDTPMSTSTFDFSSLLTVDNSITGKPVKKLYSFAILLDHVSTSNELCTELVFVTIPPPSSSSTTRMLTTPVHIRGNITLTPQSPDTTIVTLTATMEVTQEVEGPKSELFNSGTGFGIASAAFKTVSAGHKTMLPSGYLNPSSMPTAPSPKTAAAILSHVTNAVLSLHNRYARYEAVDKAMYDACERVTIPNAPPIQPHENNLIVQSLSYDEINQNQFKRIKGTVREPVEYFQMIESDKGVWRKAVATVDASAARVFADRWCRNTYEHGEKYAGTLDKAIQIPNTHSMLVAFLLRLPNPVSDRVFTTWLTWRKEPDGSFVIAFAPLSEYKKFDSATAEINNALSSHAAAAEAVRGTVKGFWRIKPLAPSICHVTYLVQAELGGSIPTALLNVRIKDTLGVLQTMQVKYARNGMLVDKEMRDVFANPPSLADLSEEQMSVVEGCRSLESEDRREWETIASPSPFVTMWMKRTLAKENERSIAIGKAAAVIDCPVHEALGESSEASASSGAMSIANERLAKEQSRAAPLRTELVGLSHPRRIARSDAAF